MSSTPHDLACAMIVMWVGGHGGVGKDTALGLVDRARNETFQRLLKGLRFIAG